MYYIVKPEYLRLAVFLLVECWVSNGIDLPVMVFFTTISLDWTLGRYSCVRLIFYREIKFCSGFGEIPSNLLYHSVVTLPWFNFSLLKILSAPIKAFLCDDLYNYNIVQIPHHLYSLLNLPALLCLLPVSYIISWRKYIKSKIVGLIIYG